jgi:hypothetical protein
MKNLILILLAVIGVSIGSYAQTYNPALSTPTNKALGIAQATPTDARSYFYDATNFVYRPYQSTSEVLSYLNLSKYRTGQFDIVVNTGGTLSNGVITGGTNTIWYFKNGTANGDLVLKETVHSVNGQVGVVVAKNADSLKGQVLDTTVRRHNYVITYDSTNRKYYLAAGGSGTTYTAGAGIDITSSVIAAQTTTALWNAAQLRGRNISTTAPTTGQVLKWDGSSYTPAADNSALDTSYFSNDTLFLVAGTDTSRVHLALVPTTDNWGNQTVVTDTTTGIRGSGVELDPIYNDTTIVATQAMLRHKIDSLAAIGAVGISQVDVDSVTIFGDGANTDLYVDTNTVSTKAHVQHIADSLADANFIADGSETIILPGTTGISITGSGTDPYIVNNTATDSSGSNPLNALSILDYDGIADATEPTSGSNADGTSNTSALNAMFAAAATGQLCIIPNGKWLFSTPVDTIKGPKRINLLILGDTYHNGSDFLIFTNASGPTEQHTVVHLGSCIGRINIPSHSATTYANGTKPVWSTFSGTAFKVYNANQMYVKFNKLIGFKNGVEVIGNDYDDQNRGSQENTFVGRYMLSNANNIVLTSLNGKSYCDKNYFSGWDNGTIRVSGGLAIKIDGYSGTASNGEVYNGAFRSNEFHLMVEVVDSIAECHGDITEPKFDVTVEGSGVLGAIGWRMRTVSPNYVRSPVYNGRGVFAATWVDDGMGRNATINVPTYTSSDPNIGFTFWGNQAITDDNGNIIMLRPIAGLTKAKRDSGFARHGFRFLDFGTEERDTTVPASTYTIGAGYRYVTYTAASGIITLPTASSSVSRVITIFNGASTTVSVGNVLSGDQNTIPAGKVMTYRCNGANWRSVINPEGSTTGGTSQWTTSGSYIYYNNNIAVGSTSPHQYAWIQPGASTSANALFEFPTSSVDVSTPRNGNLWYNGTDMKWHSSSVTQTIATNYNTLTFVNKFWQGYPIDIDYWSPDGGAAKQIARVNSSATAMEFAYPNYTLFYTGTASTAATTTSSTGNSFLGGAKTITGGLAAGDEVVLTGSGIFNVANVAGGTPSIDFVCGSQTLHVGGSGYANLVTGYFEYEFSAIPTTTGTNVTTFIHYKVTFTNGSTGAQAVLQNFTTLSALNTTTPTVNAIGYWSSSGNTMTSYRAKVEVNRK